MRAAQITSAVNNARPPAESIDGQPITIAWALAYFHQFLHQWCFLA